MVGWLDWYRYRRTVTIDHTKISASLTDFPLLLNITNPSGITGVDLSDFISEVNGQKKFAVTKDDGVTECPIEVEFFVVGDGLACLWTKIPAISDAVDTVLYLYYDGTHAENLANVGDVGSAVGQSVWDANFQGVYHLSEATDAVDSTANAVNGTDTNINVQQPSKIAFGNQFPSAVAKIDLGNPAGFDQASIMVEAWIKTSQAYAEDGRIITVGSGATNKWLLTMNVTSNRGVMSNTTASHATKSTNAAINNGAWRHLVGTTNPEAIYLDGILQTGTVTDSWSFEANSKIGSRGTARQFIGYMDEVRVSDKNRGAEYALASYNSGNDSLVTYGDREEMLCTAKATFLT